MPKPRHQKVKTEIEQETKSSFKLRPQDLIKFEPLTQKQSDFFNLYDKNNNFIFLSGFAGTGKTFIALYKSLEDVLDKKSNIKKVLIIRSTVQTRDIGHLPGSVEEKISVFSQPYQAICKEIFNRGDAWYLLTENKMIDFCSTSFLRGNTFNDTVIIFDEIQNCNWSELNTVVSRIGNNSKIIFCGDYRQNDLIYQKNDQSALEKFITIACTMPSFNQIEFGLEDCIRSGLCKEWLTAEYNYEKSKRKIFI